MFGIGPEELMVILVLALLVLGPERLPKVARDLGKVVGDLRRTSDELRDEFMNADKYVQGSAAGGTQAAPGPHTATPIAATSESATAGPPDESAFDREMREARERLRNL